MKQLFLNVEHGGVKLIDTPLPVVKDETVIVETLYSAVSAGTERSLTSFGEKNLIQKALERPDQVKKVLDKISTDGLVATIDSAFGKLKEPMPMGYSAVGRVVSAGRGVTKCMPGDYVAMAGQAYHAEVNRVNQNLIAKIPDSCIEEVGIAQYALCALGGIALEGIHQAQVVPGETIAVIGMGLLGHILSRILNAYGCDVIGFDVCDKTLPDTKLLTFLDSNDENAADKVKALTKGYGADKVIITASTSSNGPIDLSAAIARDRAIICMIGVTKMELNRRPYYEKELSFTIARSYGPGRYDPNYEDKGVDYPIGHVRFTEGRNLEEYVRLVSSGRIQVKDLITHVIDFEEAASAYEMITSNPNKEKYIGVLLKYSENEEKFAPTIGENKGKKSSSSGKIRVGLIGAGGFAKSVIIPTMLSTGKYEMVGIATTGGVNAAQASELADFKIKTNNYKELLICDEIDLVVVSTNHNSHAKFVIEALNANKHVYCEKPLCLSLEELNEIREAYNKSEGELFVGLNRRYAPLIQKLKEELKTDKIPAVYEYTVNAGYIPENHWTQDEKVGGGRIIGEAIHFIDTIQSLDGSKIVDLNVSFLESEGYKKKDNCFITLKFESGAIGNVVYTSMGSKKYPKEVLRVFSGGVTAELVNYLSYKSFGANKKNKIELKQDKGISSEYANIAEVCFGKLNAHIEKIIEEHELLLKQI